MSLGRDAFRIGTVPKQVDHLFQIGAQLRPVYTLRMSAGETRHMAHKEPRIGACLNDRRESTHDRIRMHDHLPRSMRATTQTLATVIYLRLKIPLRLGITSL
jgi:hypothetical protein